MKNCENCIFAKQHKSYKCFTCERGKKRIYVTKDHVCNKHMPKPRE